MSEGGPPSGVTTRVSGCGGKATWRFGTSDDAFCGLAIQGSEAEKAVLHGVGYHLHLPAKQRTRTCARSGQGVESERAAQNAGFKSD